MTPSAELDIVLPVYQEAQTIAQTLRGIVAAIGQMTTYRIVVAADVSPDGTVEVLEMLAAEFPLVLDTSADRRGYSGAVRSGIRRTEARYVLCIDSDGQYDPHDIMALWQHRHEADIVSGWRVRRADTVTRRIGSAMFGAVFRALFRVPMQDPSSSIVLFKREVGIELEPRLRNLPEGFWWEFNAAAHRRGKSFIEVPVSHRQRAGGSTQLFSPLRLPGVVWRQGVGLVRMAASR